MNFSAYISDSASGVWIRLGNTSKDLQKKENVQKDDRREGDSANYHIIMALLMRGKRLTVYYLTANIYRLRKTLINLLHLFKTFRFHIYEIMTTG